MAAKLNHSLLIVAVLLLISGHSYAGRFDEGEIPTVGPIDDCLKSAALYTRQGDLEAECSLNYAHFFAKVTPRRRNTATTRIASFNLFHLGDQQTPIKNFKLMAQIINQWDFVAAQELMPLPNETAENNRRIFDLIQTQTFPRQLTNWQVIAPGYLRLLAELRQFDSSWALLAQSFPEGEGSTGEMAGFYYRASKVQVKEWEYCPRERSTSIRDSRPLRNLACTAQVPEEKRRLMSRTAFAGYFQIGNFDFIAATSHSRFRPVESPEDLATQKTAICADWPAEENCKILKDHIGRFYEVKSVADEFPRMKQVAQDDDLIYMGDFNLEIAENTARNWQSALHAVPTFAVYQSEKTTLSERKQQMASNYDHFIFDPQTTSECQTASVRRFNFTDISNTQPIFQAIAASLAADHRAQILSAQQVLSNQLIRGVHFGRNFRTARYLDESEQAELVSQCTAALTRSSNTFTFLKETLSDHLPIEMECSTRAARAQP